MEHFKKRNNDFSAHVVCVKQRQPDQLAMYHGERCGCNRAALLRRCNRCPKMHRTPHRRRWRRLDRPSVTTGTHRRHHRWSRPGNTWRHCNWYVSSRLIDNVNWNWNNSDFALHCIQCHVVINHIIHRCTKRLYRLQKKQTCLLFFNVYYFE